MSETKEDKFNSNPDPPLSKNTTVHGWERFFTIKQQNDGIRVFRILQLGHKNIVDKDVVGGDENTPWMDEHAVRIRAGLLHVLAWISILNSFFLREPKIALTVISIAIWEFTASLMFGLTPLAPLGTMATALAMILFKEPLWVPARPKRFAWSLGLGIVVSCLICWRIGWEYGFKQKHEEMMMMNMGGMGDDGMDGMDVGGMNNTDGGVGGDGMDMGGMNNTDGGMGGDGMDMGGMNMDEGTGCMVMDMNDLSEFPVAAAMLICIKTFVITCLLLTWLEGNCGFCLGCFIYNTFPCVNRMTPNTEKESKDVDNFHCEECAKR